MFLQKRGDRSFREMEDRKLQSAETLNRDKFLRRSLEFVISVCVLSFFVWYSSDSGFSILPHDQSFNVFLFSMITRTLERKYMFLICNGILAFLAKTSSSTFSSTSSSKSPANFTLELQAPNFPKAQISEEYASRLVVEEEEEEEEAVEQARKQEDCEEMLEDDTSYNKMEEGKKEAVIGDEEEEEGKTEDFTVDEEEEKEDVDTALMATDEELVNTEELNRKFEEFIRKMKEEIRIGAQRQLIAV